MGALVSARRGIKVARMTLNEAKSLFAAVRNEDNIEEDKNINKLLQELQFHPLAVTQAASYMRRTLTLMHEYLSMLAHKKKRWSLLKENECNRHRKFGVPNSILETWSISIERIQQESEMAFRILHIISYLDSQNIPDEVVIAASTYGSNEDGMDEDGGQNRDELSRAMIRLKDFSFLSMHRKQDGSRSYEMHKLVQEAARYGLSMREPLEEEKQKIFRGRTLREGGESYFSNAVLQVIAGLFDQHEMDEGIQVQRDKYLTHAVQIAEWAEICGKEAEVSDLLSRVSSFLYARGRWREKELVDDRALRLRQVIFGERHQDTIKSMSELASAYYGLGRYKEAEEIEIKVLELRQEILGERHPDTIEAELSLAATHYAQGRYNEAEGIEIKVSELQRQVLGEKHPDTITAMHSLAMTWHLSGRRRDGIMLMEQTLQSRRDILGPGHPLTAASAKVLEDW